MSFNIPLTSEKDFSDNITNTIFALGGIANRKPLGSHNQIVEVNSWSTVQSIVKLGLANRFFQVGDQLQSHHGTYGTGEQHLLTWDIIGIDHDIPCTASGTQLNTIDASGNTIPMHSLTLQLHDCISTSYSYNLRVHTETGTSKNNWRDSDTRAWLNTDGIITDYSANKGFLDNFDPDLLAVIGYCAKSTLRNKANGGDGGKAIIITEKFFLPSMTEVFGRTDSTTTDDTIPESAIFKSEDTVANPDKKYYVADTSNVLTVAVPTGTESPKTLGWYEIKAEYDFYGADRSDYDNPNGGNDVNRKKKVGTGFSEWWLRSPVTPYTGSTHYVNNNGGLLNFHDDVARIYGIAPACVIC